MPNPIPQEGKIESAQILDLFSRFSTAPIFQATISEDLEGAEGLAQILQANPPSENPKLYLVEHLGHFILLQASQVEGQIHYDIFDSLLHTPNGELRRSKVAEILAAQFLDQEIVKQNQYLQVAQGVDGGTFADGSIDADNCGLSALAAHFIFEQFGGDFPAQILVQNRQLYHKFNNILLKFRDPRGFDVDAIKDELLVLATQIMQNQELHEGNLDLVAEIMAKNAISKAQKTLQNEAMQFGFKRSQEDNVNLRWRDFAQDSYQRAREDTDEEYDFAQFRQNSSLFAKILVDIYLNHRDFDENQLKGVFGYYEYIFEEYLSFREKIFANFNDSVDKIAANQECDREELQEMQILAQNLINIGIRFYEFRKILSEEQKAKNPEFAPAQSYDPLLMMAEIVMKSCEVGRQNLILLFEGLGPVIERAIALLKESEAAYLQSENSAHKVLLDHLSNSLVYVNLLKSPKFTPEMAASYAKSASSSPNSHNAFGLLMDYALNGNVDSAKRAKEAFAGFSNDILAQNLEVLVEMLLVRYSDVYGDEAEKKRLDRSIFNVLKGGQFDAAIAKSQKLQVAKNYFALHILEANKKAKAQVDTDFIRQVEIGAMEEPFASLGFICKIGLKLRAESIASLESYLTRTDVSNLDKLYNLHYFRDAFVYDLDYVNHLSQESLGDAIALYDKFLAQNLDQDLRFAALSSKFKLCALAGQVENSRAALNQIVEIAKKDPSVARHIKIAESGKLLAQIQKSGESDIEARQKLLNDAGFLFGESEISVMAQNEFHLSFGQRLRDHETRKLEKSRQESEEKTRQDARIRIKIDGKELFLDQLHSFKNNGATYYVHVDQGALDASGELADDFLSAAQSEKFSRAKGESGIKFIKNDIYELKINGDSRILGKLCEIGDQSGNKVNLMVFSKFVDKAHVGGQNKTGANYKAAQKSLTENPPKVEYLGPKNSPQGAEASLVANDKSKNVNL